MKNVVNVLTSALQDAELSCDVSLSREINFLREIVKHQGFGFVSIAMPRLGAFLEEGLEKGHLPDFPQNMRVFGRCGKGPDFLRELFRLVFDSSGKLLDNPSHEAILWIRQLAYTFKKVKIGCSRKREYAAERKFVETDLRVACSVDEYRQPYVDCLTAIADMIIPRIFSELESSLERRELIPKHGPGAVADKLLPNERYSLTYWHERLEPWFPAADYLVPNYNMWLDYEKSVRIVPADEEQPVRVVFVPKTQKTPRVIAIEPAAMQYCQQALQHVYRDSLSWHSQTSHVFNWEDQSVNKSAAERSSIDRSLTTIDLSEASDRVSLCLVERIHRKTPNLLEAMLCCRSTKAELPNGNKITLRKFASMGSAMCFPVEALTFYVIVLSAIAFGARPNVRSSDEAVKVLIQKSDSRLISFLKEIGREVRVYGDDIIIPREHTLVVYEWLEAFGLKVNTSKSFSEGHFRESCGGDYYDGTDVTPVYCRSIELPTRRNASALGSWVAFRNHCYKRGFWRIARSVDLLLRMYYGHVPHQADDSPGIYLSSFRNWCEVGRWNKSLQKHRRLLIQIKATTRRDSFSLPGFLMAFFLSAVRRINDAFVEKTAIKTGASVRRGSVRMVSRWT